MLLEDAFTRLVREPLEVLPGQEPEKQVIVMVDALDEALTYSGGINIVSLLAQVEYLPPGARFILTSRKLRKRSWHKEYAPLMSLPLTIEKERLKRCCNSCSQCQPVQPGAQLKRAK